MIDALDHVHVYVEDVPAAAAWYRQLLGFEHDPTFALWYQQGGPFVIRCAAASLSLFQRQSPKPGNTIAFVIQAIKVATLVDRLQKYKVAYSVVDHHLTWSIYFEDLCGNPLEVTCNDYAAATPMMVAAS
ncbi:VOC family protein [Rosenbergiella sp. S61]|uniref:VOC family protein n=1 Tax=Rosenbergiella gaditana TaxID=2726987 RepID=A0ABS5STG3_9GAMM|nr:VOC family protein [Rosenbergiella gaditana]MBT0723380.1 VOC family protein [Rosenbergiella gaditana]